MANFIVRSRLAWALMLVAMVATLAQAQVRDTIAAARATAEQTYFEFQVEKPVRHAPGSAAPRYPPELKAASVEGEVLAQFVVDTLGAPLLHTFRVLKSSHGVFTESVKTALPGMKFVPAELRGRKVRQLVQQPFVFAIQKRDNSAAAAGVLRAPLPPPAMPPASITPPPRSGTVRGWTIVSRLAVDSGNGSSGLSLITRRFGTAGRTRVEVEPPARFPAGLTVSIIDSAAGRRTQLHPAQKSASVTQLAGRSDALFTAKFRPSPDGITDLGAGETIAGLPTRHYRVTGTTTSRFNLGTQFCVVTQPTVAEYWTTTDPAFVSVQRQSRGLGAAMLGPSPNPLPLVDSSDDLSRLGSFLKVVSHNVGPVRGMGGAMTVVHEVLSFFDGTLEASLFEPPEGYQLRDLTSVMPSARTDSLRAAMTKRTFEQWVDTTKVVPGVTTTCTTSKAP